MMAKENQTTLKSIPPSLSPAPIAAPIYDRAHFIGEYEGRLKRPQKSWGKFDGANEDLNDGERKSDNIKVDPAVFVSSSKSRTNLTYQKLFFKIFS